MTDVLSRLKPYATRADAAIAAALADVQPATLRDAVAHYPRAGGKRLRPCVALIGAEAAGGKAEDALPVAVACELIHDFSLVHDDIMDRDALRRGMPTVHAKWGEPLGILAGDALLAKAFETLAGSSANGVAVQRAVVDAAQTTAALCEGQALDMEFEARDDVSEDDYVRMIDGKTAALYAFAARAGAALAGGREAELAALATWGREFGLAFQIRDDVLDVIGSAEGIGKTPGKDVRSGKKTILALRARERATGPDAATLARVLGRADATGADVAAVVEVFRSTGALAHAESETRRRAEAAVRALEPLRPTPARRLLEDLARWSAERAA